MSCTWSLPGLARAAGAGKLERLRYVLSLGCWPRPALGVAQRWPRLTLGGGPAAGIVLQASLSVCLHMEHRLMSAEGAHVAVAQVVHRMPRLHAAKVSAVSPPEQPLVQLMLPAANELAAKAPGARRCALGAPRLRGCLHPNTATVCAVWQCRVCGPWQEHHMSTHASLLTCQSGCAWCKLPRLSSYAELCLTVLVNI